MLMNAPSFEMVADIGTAPTESSGKRDPQLEGSQFSHSSVGKRGEVSKLSEGESNHGEVKLVHIAEPGADDGTLFMISSSGETV